MSSGDGSVVQVESGGAGVAAALRSSGDAPAIDLTTTHIPPESLVPDKIVYSNNPDEIIIDNNDDNDDYGFYLPLDGGMVKLKGTALPGAPPPGGPRSKVTVMSRASRKRLLQHMASVDRTTRPPLFIGLTYPGDCWPDDPAVWHQHLETFWKRICRLVPALKPSMFWRLEPQKRGAPHFHLLIFGIPYLGYKWIAANWSEIVGGDEKHRRSCSRVERVKSWRGAMSYASKYLGKVSDGAGFSTAAGLDITEPGRHWGIKGRQHLPVTWVRYAVGLRQFHQIRRSIARYMRSLGRKHRIRGRHGGVWCFMPASEALRLVGLFSPLADMQFEAPKL